ncbi:PQQ-dependent sugar dehydrogenase [Vibrio algivorus]|uniref:PQQ-dependent sugar dehydrogenase n=1 Tax=Vibrio algivorus TaxID=1667024 RepID=A0A557NYC6_9VIBR|nr:PQQ-dependent sugar dehydrogenase [Vibrio algivorus]TVO33410.1 PQQ-dependent sugar dehydrogenase [Vibrio algivorus]
MPMLSLLSQCKRYSSLLLFSSIAAFPSIANTQDASENQQNYTTKIVANNLGVIWGMDWVDTNHLLMTERNGHVYLLDLTTKQKSEISGLPDIKVSGQGGLLDVARYTDSNKQTWFYFTYVKPLQNGNSATTLARAQLDINKKALTQWQDLLVTDSADDSSKHFGSRITFNDTGHVFFGVGDRGNRDNGQNMDNQAASILRLNVDGSIPQDNPFVENKQGNPAVWSFGHRNPQGLVFDQNRKILWEVEHGPRGGDEINIIKPGLNYGWAKTSHGKEYWNPLDVGEAKTLPGIEPPLMVYIPSIAPSSAVIYHGEAFSSWNGNMLIGALAGTHINMVSFDEQNQPKDEVRLVEDLNERVRDVIIGNKGLIYFSTDSGKLYQLIPK